MSVCHADGTLPADEVLLVLLIRSALLILLVLLILCRGVSPGRDLRTRVVVVGTTPRVVRQRAPLLVVLPVSSAPRDGHFPAVHQVAGRGALGVLPPLVIRGGWGGRRDRLGPLAPGEVAALEVVEHFHDARHGYWLVSCFEYFFVILYLLKFSIYCEFCCLLRFNRTVYPFIYKLFLIEHYL